MKAPLLLMIRESGVGVGNVDLGMGSPLLKHDGIKVDNNTRPPRSAIYLKNSRRSSNLSFTCFMFSCIQIASPTGQALLQRLLMLPSIIHPASFIALKKSTSTAC